MDGKPSERQSGKVDSSDKSHDIKRAKKPQLKKKVVVEKRERLIGYKGQEFPIEKASELIGSIFTGDDGKRYKYIRKLNSSTKQGLEIKVVETHYYKLEYVEVDAEGKPLPDAPRATAVSAQTDFLKKSPISILLMAFILNEWLGLKCPLNRVADLISSYGIKLQRQKLYMAISLVCYLCRPVYDHFFTKIPEEKVLYVDETYHKTREKRRKKVQNAPPDDKATGRKAQKSAAKSMRSYFYGIVGDLVCLYLHDLDRDSKFVTKILKKHGIKPETFVVSDGFYRVEFNLGKDKESRAFVRLFLHGLCWVHTKRYFCVLDNYATKKDGTIIDEYLALHWEQDVIDAQRIKQKISAAFHCFNEITARCENDPTLDISILKDQELRPLISEIIRDAHEIYDQITASRGQKPKRQCSKKLRTAIGYIVNNEEKLQTFLESPFGVMHSSKVEEKFREFDILRNSMMASDTCHGADNLAQMYSFYKTAQMHGIEFESYMEKVLTVVTEHMHEIKFKYNERGTIIDYESNSIPAEVLESLMPWNMKPAASE